MIRAMSERLVNSSKTGLSMRRRIESRARPGSAPAKISGIKERSERSRSRRRVLRLLLSLCWSRSQAERMALSSSGLISSGQSARFLQSQKSISLVAECSRKLRFKSGAQFVQFAGFGEDLRHRRHQPRVAALHEMQGAGRSSVHRARRAGRGGLRRSFAEGSFEQNGREPRLFFDDQTLEREIRLDRCSFGGLEKIVAADDELESHRRIEPLVPARGLLDRVDERLQLLFRLLEFVMQLDDLVERGGLLLGLARLVEKGEQFVGARDRRSAQFDRLVLFRRDKKVAFFLKQFLGRVPPAFEFRLVENVA